MVKAFTIGNSEGLYLCSCLMIILVKLFVIQGIEDPLIFETRSQSEVELLDNFLRNWLMALEQCSCHTSPLSPSNSELATDIKQKLHVKPLFCNLLSHKPTPRHKRRRLPILNPIRILVKINAKSPLTTPNLRRIVNGTRTRHTLIVKRVLHREAILVFDTQLAARGRVVVGRHVERAETIGRGNVDGRRAAFDQAVVAVDVCWVAFGCVGFGQRGVRGGESCCAGVFAGAGGCAVGVDGVVDGGCDCGCALVG